MSRVLHVISSMETGGAQKLLSELLPALGSIGTETTLVVFRRTGNHLEKTLEENGIEIISLDIDNNKSPRLIPALRKHISAAEIAHIHLFPSLYEAAAASAGLPTPLVYTEHSTSNRRRAHRWMRPLERRVYGAYTRIAAISPQAAAALSEWVGPKVAPRIATIENGIDIGKISDAEPVFPAPGSKTILMISRFSQSKDQQTLIRALPLVADKNIKVMFAGDGPTLPECRRLAESLNLSGRILFLGSRSDAPSLAKGATIGVQSSNWEGFGLTAVEMMAAGIPVIASDVDGLRQVVEDAGLLFPKGDEKMLARQIDALLGNSALYGETARKSVLRADDYSIARTARRYDELYNSILNGSSLS